MIRATSLAVLAIASLAFAAPAVAKTSVATGKKLCIAAAKAQQPAPAKVTVDSDVLSASAERFEFKVRLKAADGAAGRAVCTVDRAASTATLAPQA